MLTVLDLFSCIGGHALGLHATGGFTTVGFVEKDEWRRKVLAHHFPDTPIGEDIFAYEGRQGEADLVVGGPPCQGTSVAAAIQGKRTGATLWPEMGRIIGRVEPKWVVVEQPPGNRTWEATVQGDLEKLGYHAARVVLSAADLGAPHLRRRVFTLAHRDLSRLQVAGQARSSAVAGLAWGAAARNPWRQGVPRGLRVADGVPARIHGHSLGGRIGECHCQCHQAGHFQETCPTSGSPDFVRTMRLNEEDATSSRRFATTTRCSNSLSPVPLASTPGQWVSSQSAADPVLDLRVGLPSPSLEEAHNMQQAMPVGGRATQCCEAVGRTGQNPPVLLVSEGVHIHPLTPDNVQQELWQQASRRPKSAARHRRAGARGLPPGWGRGGRRQ